LEEYFHTVDEDRGLDRVTGPTFDLVVRRRGAEVIGLTWKGPAGPLGLLWRNGRTDDPPRFWKSHATVLFPIVGGLHGNRSRTTDGTEVRFRGLHGFARHKEFELVEVLRTGDGLDLVYSLSDDDETRELYPFAFLLSIVYSLRRSGLCQSITVMNRGDRALPFQVGWHPGFNAPLAGGEKRDCRLRLPGDRVRRMLNDADCRLTGEWRWEASRGDFKLTEEELDATYMFDLSDVPPGERVVTLTDPSGSPGVRVAFPDYPHLGIWSDAGAPFVCIEPWQGMDDHAHQEAFDRKFGVVLLPPGGVDSRRAWIEVIEV
jgi:galactose mutarotase-like enzyme